MALNLAWPRRGGNEQVRVFIKSCGCVEVVIFNILLLATIHKTGTSTESGEIKCPKGLV